MVDGLLVTDVGSYVITDRQKLADNGVLILGITVDSVTKEVIAGPDVQMRGLISLKDADSFVKELIALFESSVIEIMQNYGEVTEESRVKLRDKIVAFVRKNTGKDPMVLPVIIEV